MIDKAQNMNDLQSLQLDTALRLARYFKMSPQFWLGLQMDYELDLAEDALEKRIEHEIRPMVATG